MKKPLLALALSMTTPVFADWKLFENGYHAASSQYEVLVSYALSTQSNRAINKTGSNTKISATALFHCAVGHGKAQFGIRLTHFPVPKGSALGKVSVLVDNEEFHQMEFEKNAKHPYLVPVNGKTFRHGHKSIKLNIEWHDEGWIEFEWPMDGANRAKGDIAKKCPHEQYAQEQAAKAKEAAKIAQVERDKLAQAERDKIAQAERDKRNLWGNCHGRSLESLIRERLPFPSTYEHDKTILVDIRGDHAVMITDFFARASTGRLAHATAIADVRLSDCVLTSELVIN